MFVFTQLLEERLFWATKAVLSTTGIFVAIANNTLFGPKLYIFLLYQKSLNIK